jgi:hypothetical protein
MVYVIGLVLMSINLGMEIKSPDHSWSVTLWLALLDAIAFLCVLFHVLRIRDKAGESIWM